jgi:tRNA-dihydrouridine synthase
MHIGPHPIDNPLALAPMVGVTDKFFRRLCRDLSQVVELVWQLRGLAEGRQVDARVGLAQSIGGLATNNWVALLERRP